MLVPNGDLAHVILFGTFAGFALLGQRLIDRRKRREMGKALGRFGRKGQRRGAPAVAAAAACGGFGPLPAADRRAPVALRGQPLAVTLRSNGRRSRGWVLANLSRSA